MFTPGHTIGPYELKRRLGGGAFGEVWLARHLDLGVERAMKIPTDPDYVRQLRKEGQIQFNLKHLNIVETFDLNTHHDPPYFVMEWIDGEDLARHLAARGSVGVEEALAVVQQILGALVAAHGEGIIHRDLKPSNILLTRDGTVKVTDFGLGRVKADVAQSLLVSGSVLSQDEGSVSGTLEYMSPAQRAGQPPDPRDDLYALGIIGCELLTGRRPSAAGAARALGRAGIAKGIIEVFERACDDPEYSYPSAAEMLADVERVMAGAAKAPVPAVLDAAAPVDVAADGATLEKNLQRILHAGLLDAFVARHAGCWGHDDWMALLAQLRREGYWPADEKALVAALGRSLSQWQQAQPGRRAAPAAQRPAPPPPPVPPRAGAPAGVFLGRPLSSDAPKMARLAKLHSEVKLLGSGARAGQVIWGSLGGVFLLMMVRGGGMGGTPLLVSLVVALVLFGVPLALISHFVGWQRRNKGHEVFQDRYEPEIENWLIEGYAADSILNAIPSDAVGELIQGWVKRVVRRWSQATAEVVFPVSAGREAPMAAPRAPEPLPPFDAAAASQRPTPAAPCLRPVPVWGWTVALLVVAGLAVGSFLLAADNDDTGFAAAWFLGIVPGVVLFLAVATKRMAAVGLTGLLLLVSAELGYASFARSHDHDAPVMIAIWGCAVTMLGLVAAAVSRWAARRRLRKTS